MEIFYFFHKSYAHTAKVVRKKWWSWVTGYGLQVKINPTTSQPHNRKYSIQDNNPAGALHRRAR